MTPEERFSRALHSTARQWRVALDARLKDLGVSQAGWMTIALVAKADTPPSQGELATQLSVEPATMVAMIDRLVKAGLVERVASTADRRIKHIHLTAAGREISDEVHAKAQAFRMDILRGFDADTLHRFSELLEKIQKRIETSS
jgi:MarR family transcriptional regulator for hemolysin